MAAIVGAGVVVAGVVSGLIYLAATPRGSCSFICEGPLIGAAIMLGGAAASLVPFIVAIVLAAIDVGKPPAPVQSIARALLPRLPLPALAGQASITPLTLALAF